MKIDKSIIFKNFSLKTIFIVSIVFVAIGCSPLREVEGYKNSDKIDFSNYTKQGFMLTPEPYSGNYESCGLIKVEINPSVRKYKNIPKEEKSNYKSVFDIEGSEYYSEIITVKDVLDKLVQQAKEINADCIMNLEFKSTDYSYTDFITLHGLSAYGFAIKRIQK